MSHATVLLLTTAEPTQSDADREMEPFHEERGHSKMNGCGWDYFTMNVGRGQVASLLASRKPIACWGIVVWGAFFQVGKSWDDRPVRTEGECEGMTRAVLGRFADMYYTELDVHQ